MAVHTRAATQQRASTGSSSTNSNSSYSYHNRISRNHTKGNIKTRPQKIRFQYSEHNVGGVGKKDRTTRNSRTDSEISNSFMVECKGSNANNKSPKVASEQSKKVSRRNCGIKKRSAKVALTIESNSAGAKKSVVGSTKAAKSKEVVSDISKNINIECLNEPSYPTGVRSSQRAYSLLSYADTGNKKDYADAVEQTGSGKVQAFSKNSLRAKVHSCEKVRSRYSRSGKTTPKDKVGKSSPKLKKVNIETASGKTKVILVPQKDTCGKGALPSSRGATNTVTSLGKVKSSRSGIAFSEDSARCKKSGKMFQYSPNLSIPTRTTSTLTPTTLRNIQDSFVEYDNEVQPPMEHQMAAGFAPPSVIVQQFASNGTHNSQGVLTPVVGTNPNSNSLEDNAVSTLQRERHDIEVKQEIIEEDAGWVQTPWTDPGLLPSTASRSGTAGDITNSSVVDFQQGHLNFPQISDVTRTSVPSLIGSVEDCNGANTANKRRTALSNCAATSRGTTTFTPSSAHEQSCHPSTSRRNLKDEGLPPEEEERRRQRRERNKLAAARCRQRRVDQTKELQDEVDGLEGTQKKLRGELDSLKQAKKELEKLLQQHSCIQQRQSGISPPNNCRLRAPATATPGATSAVTVIDSHLQAPEAIAVPTQVKVIVRCKDTLDSRLIESTAAPQPQTQQPEKRTRPTSLAVNMFEGTGIPVQTPSAGMSGFRGTSSFVFSVAIKLLHIGRCLREAVRPTRIRIQSSCID
ncbi:transcription factor kayak-like isoform X2 [Varroa destructor]|uniref:BZIP domain-containing protein n=1 Tax=Varroa destructor TaxID=109461 RepID=A0A7M7KD21_VARDE|nr:transcription factor kayak-like isoform X2 [Varroa destructor]